MTSEQFAEWIAWANLRGLPQARADYSAAQICAVLGNIHRTADGKVFEPFDFIPPLPTLEDETDETKVVEQVDIEANSKAIAAMLGKKD